MKEPAMLERVSRFCYHRRRLVVAVWIALLIGLTAFGQSLGSAASDSFKLGGTESARAQNLLQERFPARSGASGSVVFEAANGVQDPQTKADVTALLARIKAQPRVAGITSPYDPTGARQVSQDGRIGFADVRFDTSEGSGLEQAGHALLPLAKDANRPGLQVELSGMPFESHAPPSGADMIGILAAVIILLAAFGSVLAMGLPIITALFGIGTGLAIVSLLTHVMSIPTFADQLAAMIGIGVGIDYALFIVTRYRQTLHGGADPEEAVVVALTTSGRAVLFAGTTVVISMLGLTLMGLEFVTGMAVGAVAAVLMTMFASITLLPAILGFAGHKIDGRRARRRMVDNHRETMAYRWSRQIQRRPWPFAIGGFLVLITLATPVLSIRLGSSDQGSNPTSDTTRRAYDLLSKGFGPGYNGPLVLAAELPSAASAPVLERLRGDLSKVPGVAAVSPAVLNPAGDTAVMQVFPTTSPQDVKTANLISSIRAHTIPAAVAGTGVRVNVGGITATFDDLSKQLSRRLPLFIGAVIGLSFLLLMAVFRSVLVPLKAAIMNLLSIGAAYGIVVAVFQWGYGGGLVGIGKTGPIESFLPMMLFAILFGLSMDYEVFLLSRIREEYLRGHDNRAAVADGLAATARVITAAAAIMVCVFVSFVFGGNRTIKLFGLGLSSAIFIDATVVRMILVPATMELLGDANWWLPKWLDRLIPHISVGEGESELSDEIQRALDEDELAPSPT